MKRAVINLSTKKFTPGQERLRQTVFGRGEMDLLLYTNESQVGAPPHPQAKYAFKPYALDKARKDGYDQALWLDASMYVLRSIEPIFSYITGHGYFWQDGGNHNNRWTTPEQKAYFGTDEGRMISAGVIGLDFRNKDANEFLDRWLQAAKDGMFNGDHSVTRHDQTCASLLIHTMGLSMADNDTYWSYGTPGDTFADNIVLIAHGIC